MLVFSRTVEIEASQRLRWPFGGPNAARSDVGCRVNYNNGRWHFSLDKQDVAYYKL